MSTLKVRQIDRHANANDASHYLLIPEAVARPESFDEIKDLLATHFREKRPLTFRSGGTSLSGQSLSNSLLLDSRSNFKGIEISDGGKTIKVQPGITVREINNRLKPLGYKFGPDPASEIAATVGGVIANNSSGMVCGTSENAYKTILSARIIFSDGSEFDTSAPDAETRLREIQPVLFEVLQVEKRKIDSTPSMRNEISRQYRGKNTMGYSLNAFLDFQSPVDILLHLLVGSEGTLAYIAEATFRTIPVKPFAATNLLVFNSLKAANESLAALVDTGAAAIELLDKTSLKVAQREDRAMSELKALDVQEKAAFIVEYQEFTADALSNRIQGAAMILNGLPLATPAITAQTLSSRNDLWHIRKGLYASVAGARESGTTALLEDIAVPVSALATTCENLISLFEKFSYHDSVIFGHAKDGNIHFMLNENFREEKSQNRYRDFTVEMVDLVLAHEGTLKAEHGTGRVMAPFVRQQFGDDLYDVMVALKRAFDPHGILNPDVIITENPTIHLENFKVSPTVEAEVDRCVECGFCEQGCPSKALTLTPRQRITARRSAESARQSGAKSLAKELVASFKFEGIDTCAADGMCAIACPVGINTGDLVKRLRSEESNHFQKFGWKIAAANWGRYLSMARTGVALASVFPKFRGVSLSVGEGRSSVLSETPDFIYLPSCTNEVFGPSNQSSFLELTLKAGLTAYIPEGISNVCCGTPWKSKGMTAGGTIIDQKNRKLLTQLQQLKLPIVTDSPSCADGFIKSFQGEIVLDSTQFLATHVISRLRISQVEKVVVHPTCSSAKLDENSALLTLAAAMAKDVVVPPNWGCCGFAGDRGLLIPDLTQSATAEEARYVKSIDADLYLSNNRTCEMAISAAVGREYESVIQALQRLSK